MASVTEFGLAAPPQFKPRMRVLRQSWCERNACGEFGSWDRQFTPPLVICKNNQPAVHLWTNTQSMQNPVSIQAWCFFLFLTNPWESGCLLKLSKWNLNRKSIFSKGEKPQQDYVTWWDHFLTITIMSLCFIGTFSTTDIKKEWSTQW